MDKLKAILGRVGGGVWEERGRALINARSLTQEHH